MKIENCTVISCTPSELLNMLQPHLLALGVHIPRLNFICPDNNTHWGVESSFDLDYPCEDTLQDVVFEMGLKDGGTLNMFQVQEIMAMLMGGSDPSIPRGDIHISW